jgi:tetratricopeptide (TPR) repeat protein
MGGHPLGLDIAGSYIRIASFREYHHQQLGGVSGDFSPKVWEGGVAAHNDLSATTTYNLNRCFDASFEKMSGDAQRLLFLLSFLGNEDIPTAMLDRSELKGIPTLLFMFNGVELTHATEEERKKVLQELQSSSLAKKMDDGDSYWIAPLVHKWLRAHPANTDDNAKQAVEMVVATLSQEDSRTSEECIYERRILPHINCCISIWETLWALDTVILDEGAKKIAFQLGRVLENLGEDVTKPGMLYERALKDVKTPTRLDLSLMDALGKNFLTRSQYEHARQWYTQALSGKENLLGPEDDATLQTVHNLAVLSIQQGRYQQALEEHRRILHVRRQKLGTRHPSTLDTLQGMARVLKDQCMYSEALQLLLEVRTARKEHDPTESNPASLETIHEIGVVYTGQGKYAAARKEYEHVLEGQKKNFGENHYLTLDTMHSIAHVNECEGLYQAAKKEYEKVLESTLKIFGQNSLHAWVLEAYNGVAYIDDCLGLYQDALEKYQQLYAKQRSLNSGIRGEFIAQIDVARMLNKLGRYTEAMKHFKEAEEAQSTDDALGPTHPNTLAAAFGVASVYENQGRYKDALQLFQKVLEEEQKSLTMDHPSVLQTACSVASVYRKLGRYEDASKMYGIALQGLEKALPVDTDNIDHPTTLIAVLGTATLLQSRGMYEDALKLYERGVAGRERRFGPDHPMTLSASVEKASVLRDMKRYKEALERCQSAVVGLEIRITRTGLENRKALGENHPTTRAAVHTLGTIFAAQGAYDPALNQFEKAQNELDAQDPLKLQVDCSIAHVQYKKKNLDQALRLYQKALQALETVLGEDNPITISARQGLADVYLKLKRPDEAKTLYETVKIQREASERPNIEARRLDEKLKSAQRRIEYGTLGGVWNKLRVAVVLISRAKS